jgi:hypothetical protein
VLSSGKDLQTEAHISEILDSEYSSLNESMSEEDDREVNPSGNNKNNDIWAGVDFWNSKPK